jgi:hypothetical protein
LFARAGDDARALELLRIAARIDLDDLKLQLQPESGGRYVIAPPPPRCQSNEP